VKVGSCNEICGFVSKICVYVYSWICATSCNDICIHVQLNICGLGDSQNTELISEDMGARLIEYRALCIEYRALVIELGLV